MEEPFKFRSPISVIICGKFALPSKPSPRILDHENSVALDFKDFENSVGMTRNQAHGIFISYVACTNRDETVIGSIAAFDSLPKLFSVFLLSEVDLLRKPACEDVEISA